MFWTKNILSENIVLIEVHLVICLHYQLPPLMLRSKP